MRTFAVLAANFALGAAMLGWILVRLGIPAFETLGAGASGRLLAAFVAAVAATVLALAWRWRYVLAGVHASARLLSLALQRSASHALAVLVPSGKVGGDPLRAWLAVRDGVPPADAIASVAADRTLEIGATAPFSVIFAVLLLQHGVPELERAIVTLLVGTLGLGVGVGWAVRRLRSGAGLVTALVRGTRLDRFRIVQGRANLLETSEASLSRLASQPRRMLLAFAVGLAANLLVVAEFALLLAAFDLPRDPLAVVAAVFATGAAHMLPVPGGVGVLEGAQIWLFGMLGYPAHVGLAVGLAARLRDLVWMLPGIAYGLARGASALVARGRAGRVAR
jgi:uncharacterized protein (TIRG00374 family)